MAFLRQKQQKKKKKKCGFFFFLMICLYEKLVKSFVYLAIFRRLDFNSFPPFCFKITQDLHEFLRQKIKRNGNNRERERKRKIG